MFCWRSHRSPFYFLLQAGPVNHVKCHRLIDRLCFVFLLCHEKISCLHPCHFNLEIFTSFKHRGKGASERASGAGMQAQPPPLTVAVEQLELIVDAVVGLLVVGLLKVTINNCV